MENNLKQYQSNTKIHNRSWCLLTSLIWAALGFIIVSLLSALYSYLMQNYAFEIIYTNTYIITSSILSILFFFILIYLSYKWSENIINANYLLIITNWVINIFLFVGVIAPLITLLDNPIFIYSMLGITGVIFLIIGGIGYFLVNDKFAFKLQNIIWIVITMMFVMQLIFILPFALLLTNLFSIYYLIYDFVFMIVTIIMILLYFYQIKKFDLIYNDLTNNQRIKISLFFGLKLLTCFIILFLYMIRLFLMVSKK
ncbi:MAG: hypothetical protein K2I36_02455 [Ureaplasma sp.]|nr:hypothetical protein [Ureaplasma sp.]